MFIPPFVEIRSITSYIQITGKVTILHIVNFIYCHGIAQSVKILATGWSLWGSNPGEGETDPGVYPASCRMVTGAEVKERVEL
jgi:hypothetical protein